MFFWIMYLIVMIIANLSCFFNPTIIIITFMYTCILLIGYEEDTYCINKNFWNVLFYLCFPLFFASIFSWIHHSELDLKINNHKSFISEKYNKCININTNDINEVKYK